MLSDEDEPRSMEEIAADAEQARKDWREKGRLKRQEKLQEKRRKNFETVAEGVTPRQARFCHLVSLGMPKAKAYIEAGYQAKSEKGAAEMACKIIRYPAVAKYFTELQEAAFLANVLSLAEKRSFLADTVRTPIGKVGLDSPLASSARYHKGELVEIRMPSKIHAIELDAKLAGELKDNAFSVNVGLQLVNQRLENLNLPTETLVE